MNKFRAVIQSAAASVGSGLKSAYLAVRSNPIFVTFEGGATGAALNFIYETGTTGHVDLSQAGLKQLGVAMISGGIAAVRLLYRPSPGPAQPPSPPPATPQP